jgi:serine phosphatase RsbU (regulator of sigma subunit)
VLREPLARVFAELAARHRLDSDADRLLLYGLHAAEAYLRTRPTTGFAALGWPAFRGAVLLHVARLAASPFSGRTSGATGEPAPLPDSPQYHSQTYFLPCDRVGGFWFGGDWYGGRAATDGALWVVVADVTGHGYFAYLTASGLPAVWEKVWQDAGPNIEPVALLGEMHRLLEGCLPEGVYVECTLARLATDGATVVVPAGGSRLLLCRNGGAPALIKLRGAWLGLAAPHAADVHAVTLAAGDELLMGSDGAFDQLHADGPATAWARSATATLLDDVRRLLAEALLRGPQRDDFTLVLLRRRNGAEGARDVPV